MLDSPFAAGVETSRAAMEKEENRGNTYVLTLCKMFLQSMLTNLSCHHHSKDRAADDSLPKAHRHRQAALSHGSSIQLSFLSAGKKLQFPTTARFLRVN